MTVILRHCAKALHKIETLKNKFYRLVSFSGCQWGSLVSSGLVFVVLFQPQPQFARIPLNAKYFKWEFCQQNLRFSNHLFVIGSEERKVFWALIFHLNPQISVWGSSNKDFTYLSTNWHFADNINFKHWRTWYNIYAIWNLILPITWNNKQAWPN